MKKKQLLLIKLRNAASSQSLQLGGIFCRKTAKLQRIKNSNWEEVEEKKNNQRLKTAFVVKVEKIAQSVQKKKKITALCVVYIIQLATSLSSPQEAGGMSRSVASLQGRPRDVHSHSSTDSPLFFPPFLSSTDGTKRRRARQLLYLEGGKLPRCMSRVKGS